MKYPRVRSTFGLVFALNCIASVARAQAAAEHRPGEVEGAAESQSRWSLGVRGFGGALFAGEARVGGGGGVLVAFSIVPERWEIEAGLSLAAARDRAALGVFEVVGKRIFEVSDQWSPHVLLGPLFSLDFGEELKPAGGLIVGPGVTYWFAPKVGFVSDVTYRLLIGAEVEHIVTLAVGFNFRL
jgi:hypothetical protein